MRPREAYQPRDARDTATEAAVFSGRAHNGFVPPPRNNGGGDSGATEVLRAKLPRGTDVFRQFADSDRGETRSEMLARLAREQDEHEADRQADKLRRAQEEYSEYLSSRNNHAGISEDDIEGTIDDDGRFRPTQQRQDHDANFRALEEEARRAADSIRAAYPKEIIETPPTYTKEPEGVAPVRIVATSGTTPGVTAREVSIEDTDRLWDWYRHDVGAGKETPFFGRAFKSSLELHTFVRERLLASNGAVRSFDVMDQHAGFFSLHPIDRTANVAMLHVYLNPVLRGRILDLLPYILTGARAIIPPTMNLAIYGPQWDERIGSFIAPFGFKKIITFLQEGSTPS